MVETAQPVVQAWVWLKLLMLPPFVHSRIYAGLPPFDWPKTCGDEQISTALGVDLPCRRSDGGARQAPGTPSRGSLSGQ
jgi:hypothetical protein